MKSRYYKAQDGKALIQIIVTLETGELQISVADKELNWQAISLNVEQSDSLRKFLNDNNFNV